MKRILFKFYISEINVQCKYFYFISGRSFFNIISFVSQSIKFTFCAPFFEFSTRSPFNIQIHEYGGKREERKRNNNFLIAIGETTINFPLRFKA